MQVDCPEDAPSACMSDLPSDAVFSQRGAEQNPNLKRPVSKEDFPKEMTVIEERGYEILVCQDLLESI